MQALSPTEDSMKQSSSTTLTWKEPVEMSSALRASNGVSDSPAAGPAGDLLGMNARNGPPFNTQHQLGSMNIQHNFRPQNGHQEYGSSFMESSRQNGIPDSVMVMPLIESISSSSSPPSSRKAVKSRARPRKPEEPVPFLSVDTLPADKVVIEVKSNSSKQLSRKHGRSVPKRTSPEVIPPMSGRRSQTPNHPPFSPYGGGKNTPRVPSRAGSSVHNYNSFFTHKNSAFLAGPPSLWSLGNRFWPHQVTPNEGRRRLAPIQAPIALDATTLKSNYQVSQPFKHNVDNSTPMERPLSPGQDLKESTLLALHEVTQALARQRDPPPSRKGGRLLKGKLKPLHTFQMDGPRMDECQGILTEDNNSGQTADKARLIQRKKELLSMLPHDVFSRSAPGSTVHTRPETQESIHRTSIVSAMSLDRDYPGVHPSMQHGQFRSQSMVEGTGPLGPFNSMVTVIDDSIINQVDIPAVEIQQEGGHPEGHGRKVVSGKDEGLLVPDPGRLMAGGDAADKLSDIASESNMSDYLSELEGGRAEILCNMVKKNSQSSARNDLTQLDDEPSDATELESRFEDDYPLDTVDQKDPALDTVMMSDDKVGNKKGTSALKPESQPSLNDDSNTSSNNIVSVHISVDGNKPKSDETEQSDLPKIPKSSIPQSHSTQETEEQNGQSMQIVANKQETNSTEEHLEQPVVSEIDGVQTEVPKQAIKDNQTTINVEDGPTISNEQSKSIQNTSEDVSTGTKPDDGRVESMNESNIQTVPVLNEPLNNTQISHNVPTISVVIESDKAAVEKDIENNNVEELPIHDGSAKGVSGLTDDALARTNNSDTVLTAGTNAVAIAVVIENDINNDGHCEEQKAEKTIHMEKVEGTKTSDLVTTGADVVLSEEVAINMDDQGRASSQIEQKILPGAASQEPSETNQQVETEVQSEITGKSASTNINSSETVETRHSEKVVTKQNNEDVLSSAMKEGSGKDQEDKEEDEVDDDDVKDAKEKDNGDNEDKGTDGGGSGGRGDGGSNSGSSGGGGASGEGGASGGGGGASGEGGASGGGGGASGGGGGGGGDGNDKGQSSGKDQDGNSNNPTEDEEAKNDEENQGICFKSLEQLLQEIQAQSSRRKEEELTSYDDIPEVDDPVLYCGNCGLDEDACVCPNSSLHRLLNQDDFHNRPELEDGELIDESSQQENIVLEYKMLLGEAHSSSGCYSDDLMSPREVWHEDNQHASRQSRARPSSGLPNDIMLATGVAMTPAQRPISAKVRPGSSRPSRPTSHRGTRGGRGAKVSLEDADVLSDSGCGSEMSEAMTQASQVEEDYNLDDDLDLKAQDQEQFGTETTENESKSADLEIVASTKPRHVKHKTDDVPLKAPFPPLCFKINARPPPGKLYYFAYGPTMNPSRLSTYVGSEVEQRLWGILFGFALKFNKKGQDVEAGGFANIEFSPDSSVEGCVYCLNPSQLESLDTCMGCPEFYTKIVLPVWMVNCSEPNESGVAQYCIPAVMYIAQDKWTHIDESAPLASGYSIRQCMTGADLLSSAYKQHIQTLVC